MDYNARYYSPVLGRFVSPDTRIHDPLLDLNRYGYVRNNPNKYVDPTGHQVLAIAVVGTVALVGLGVAAYMVATNNPIDKEDVEAVGESLEVAAKDVGHSMSTVRSTTDQVFYEAFVALLEETAVPLAEHIEEEFLTPTGNDKSERLESRLPNPNRNPPGGRPWDNQKQPKVTEPKLTGGSQAGNTNFDPGQRPPEEDDDDEKQRKLLEGLGKKLKDPNVPKLEKVGVAIKMAVFTAKEIIFPTP